MTGRTTTVAIGGLGAIGLKVAAAIDQGALLGVGRCGQQAACDTQSDTQTGHRADQHGAPGGKVPPT